MSDETLPTSWSTCRFDAIARVVSGKNQKEVESLSGGYPIYGSGGTFGRATKYLCEAGTTVIGRKGTINSPIFVNERFWNVDTAFGLCPIEADTLLPRLLFYFCRSFNFTVLDKSTTIPSLAKRDIEAIVLPLPPFAEQKRIVAKIEELLSELDAGEASLRQARQQLGVYRQSLLKQAFEGKLTEKWRAENPDKLESPEALLARIQSVREALSESTLRRGSKHTAKYSLDTGTINSFPQVPNSWKWVAMGNLTCLVTKGSSPKWQGFDYINDPHGVLFVTSENVRTGYLDLEHPKFLGHGFNEIQPASVLRDGDLLLNIVGASIGRAAVFRGEALANINQAVSLIRLTDFSDREFVTYYLNSSRAFRHITAKAVDVARANFSLADVNGIPIPLCSLSEQQEIVRLLDEQFEAIERNERELDAALKRSEALRQSILKKAFSGQLVPQDPADEPASQLLARIRAEKSAGTSAPSRRRRSTQSDSS